MAVIAIGTVGALTDLGTICLHVASLWPHPPMVIEADPDGGRLAVRHNWDPRPGLSDLIRASTCQDPSTHQLEATARRLRNGVKVVVGPLAIESMAVAIPGLLRSLDVLETATGGDVLIDVGIVRPDSPARELIASASCRIIVVRKDIEDLVALAHRRALLESLGHWSVLTAGGRLGVDDAADAIQWPVLADLLPHDRKSSVKLRASLSRLASRTVRAGSPLPA